MTLVVERLRAETASPYGELHREAADHIEKLERVHRAECDTVDKFSRRIQHLEEALRDFPDPASQQFQRHLGEWLFKREALLATPDTASGEVSGAD